jgi:outer membrane protein
VPKGAGAALVLLLLALSWGAEGQDIQLRFVNSEVILQRFQETQEAVQIFNQDVEEWNQEAEARKREIEQLQRDLEAQSLMLSEERRREKERDYQRKLNEYEQFVQSIWGPSGLVAQRNEELLKPIITKIQAVLDQIGSEEGYDIILDAADNNILYADPAFDITEDVILRLNEESDTETGQDE